MRRTKRRRQQPLNPLAPDLSMYSRAASNENCRGGVRVDVLVAARGPDVRQLLLFGGIDGQVVVAGVFADNHAFVDFLARCDEQLGTRTYNVGSCGAAFGVEDDTELTVLDLLRATDAMTLDGVLYDADNLSLTRALRSMANEVCSDINR